MHKPSIVTQWLANVGPPIPIEALAEHLGIRIARDPFDEKPTLAGMLVRKADHQPLIILNSRHTPERQRFTVAHEIGHFLLHDFKPVWVCQAVGLTASRLSYKQTVPAYAHEERQANRFAADLLMPTDKIRQDFDDFTAKDWDWEDEDALRQLAQRYEVTLQTLLIHLINIS